MSDQRNGGIAWTEQTWNPVRGCSRVSKGCEHCYAESVARRFAGVGQPYEGLVRIGKDGKAKAQWNGVVRVVPEHLADPLRWTRPRMVFVNSMSDLFHEALPFETIAAIFGVMAASPRHTFQVLTKRPERAAMFFRWYEGESGAGASPYAAVCTAREALANAGEKHVRDALAGATEDWPLPNVWLGVSVEDQATADERIPHLLACPAAVRWVSYEPALGPVDFTDIVIRMSDGCEEHVDALRCDVGAEDDSLGGGAAIDWIVVGGESGPGARPFDLAWARSTIAQCRAAGVACFVKQLGAVPHAGDAGAGWAVTYGERGCHWRMDDATDPLTVYEIRDRKGGDMGEWPEDLRVREWPKTTTEEIDR